MIGTLGEWNLPKRKRAEAKDRLSRLSTFIDYAYPEHAPFDYQRRYLDDHSSKWLWIEAARQVGKSVMSAHKATIKAISIPGYKHIWCSYTLDDCKEKIEYSEDLYNRIADFREFRREIPEKIVDRKLEIKFANGSRLISVFMPRGKAKADITLDEFAHVADPRKVYRAAAPILIHGGQCSVMSTPTHSRTMFARMGKREGGKFTKYRRARLFWWDCPIHCRDVPRARREAASMDPDSRVRAFGTEPLRDEFENMFLEDFLQEFELTEMDDDAAFLPWSLILECTPAGEEEGTSLEVRKYESIKELKKRTGSKLMFAGYDVGRRRDKSELSVFVSEGGRAVERYTLTLDRTDFSEQEAVLKELMSIRRVMRLRIDETGLGMNLAENLKKAFTHRVEAVSFTNDNKKAMASNMRMLMEKGKVLFSASMNKNFQMHSIKKDITSAGNVRLIVKADAGGEDHHADIFWSRALALYGVTDREAMGRPRVGWA